MTRPVDVDRVRQLFDYDPDTGLLTWKVQVSNRIRIGSVVKSVSSEGYIQVGVDGQRRLAHHVVWAWWYGTELVGDIDHINRDRKDNRISNLRDVSRSDNLLNAEYANSTGFAGVAKVASGRFAAGIHVKRARVYIGTYDTAEQAHLAYVERHIQLYGEKSKFCRAHT